ncbi:hypothetical protein OS493_006164 [Desmophyllum pertusum]|uniref:Uncharacterized protein n=1 Tax=Desmophyllum pertusum TaxID=174260 RepID=A0A9X0A4D1_9CNID|nr:hypothetical protein OS493_006164 [Desmophyllum pertusum]
MNFEPFLQLPCEDVGGNYMKQSSKCSCCCKDFQCESSCSGLASETAHLCAHASSREPESDHLEGNRSADMLQNENEEDVPFTGHPADKSSIEVCVSLLECLLSNRHVSSEVSSSGIGEISSTDSACCDDNTQHNNSFLSLRSTSNSSLNSYPTSPSSACEMPVFLRNMSPSLGKEAIEPSGGENDSNTEHLPENASTVSVHDCSESPLTLQEKRSQSSFGDNMLEDHSSMRSSYEEGLSSGEGTETRETVWLEDTPEGENSVQSVHTGCNTPSEAGHRIGSQGTPLPSFTTALQGNGEESIANDSLISQFQSESDVVFYQHQCHELRLQITQLEEKFATK